MNRFFALHVRPCSYQTYMPVQGSNKHTPTHMKSHRCVVAILLQSS